MATEADRWISFKEAGKRLGVSRQTVGRIADTGSLTILALPGHRPKIESSSVDALTRAHIRGGPRPGCYPVDAAELDRRAAAELDRLVGTRAARQAS